MEGDNQRPRPRSPGPSAFITPHHHSNPFTLAARRVLDPELAG